MKDFFGTSDEKFSYIDKYYREDIAFIPHLFDIRWARKMNELLSKVFYTPFSFEEKSYQTGKTDKHEYLAKLLPKLRSKEITKVFFTNILEDFDYDLSRAGNVSEFYGMLRGSHHLPHEPGRNTKIQKYEEFISSMATKIFVATEWFQDQVPYKTHVVGLPLYDEFLQPKSTSNLIIYNHRLASEKNPTKLFDFPEDLKKNIIISIPFLPQSSYVKDFKKQFDTRFMNCDGNDARYKQNLLNSGFGVSLAEHETFGNGVIEGIVHGLCYFAPKNDSTCYQEYMIPELLYETIDELYEKIRFYMKNPELRIEVVLAQQKVLEKYTIENWLERLMGELNE
jgi:hypothetical protein